MEAAWRIDVRMKLSIYTFSFRRSLNLGANCEVLAQLEYAKG